MRLDHLLSKEKEVEKCLTVWLSRSTKVSAKNCITFPVAMRFGETPVNIPNTMVKTLAADSTILETVWEGRWLPDIC